MNRKSPSQSAQMPPIITIACNVIDYRRVHARSLGTIEYID